jgi:hypothetical protein
MNAIPHFKEVQRRIVRFASYDYRRTSSVTAMMKQLNLTPLEVRCNNVRLVMMYIGLYMTWMTYHLL